MKHKEKDMINVKRKYIVNNNSKIIYKKGFICENNKKGGSIRINKKIKVVNSINENSKKVDNNKKVNNKIKNTIKESNKKFIILKKLIIKLILIKMIIMLTKKIIVMMIKRQKKL